MKPLRLPADPEPGLVQVFHPRRARRQVLYVQGRVPQPILRQEVGVLKVDHHPGNARAVLHRRRHPVGERRPAHRPAMPAAPGMRPVPGHLQRTRLGQIEDLAGEPEPGPGSGTGKQPVPRQTLRSGQGKIGSNEAAPRGRRQEGSDGNGRVGPV